MTAPLTGPALAEALQPHFPDAIVEVYAGDIVVDRTAVVDVLRYLKETPELAFEYLADLTTVDYLDYFEVVYHLLSFEHNRSATVKARAYGRKDPWVPSVTGLWKGADFLEREAWDLMGVRFEGHPDLRRIMLFDGFPGHPLRKDFLEFDHRALTLPAGGD